ncbi:MAG: ribonuclease P protein component [Bacteriovoracaceae bacterium]|nr:ribonuclease P protein component [Bacteriovoracaceae bacterium]
MTQFGLSKDSKLLNSQDFSYLRTDSKQFGCPWFKVYFKSSMNNFVHSRLGISVSKKVGNAVVRNRTKRIIREYFRKNQIFKSLGLEILIVISPRLYKSDKREVGEANLLLGLDKLQRFLGKDK